MGRRRRAKVLRAKHRLPKAKRKRFKKTQGRPQNIRAAKSTDYNHYLRSALWRHIRGWVLKRDDNRCQCCNETATEVHHISYDQQVMDGCLLHKLISLCHACHQRVEFDGDVHIKDMNEKYRRLHAVMHEHTGTNLRDWETFQKRVTPKQDWFRERLRKYEAWVGIEPTAAPAQEPASSEVDTSFDVAALEAKKQPPKRQGKTARRTAEVAKLREEVAFLRQERQVYLEDMKDAQRARDELRRVKRESVSENLRAELNRVNKERRVLERTVINLERQLKDASTPKCDLPPKPMYPLGERVVNRRRRKNVDTIINPKEIA